MKPGVLIAALACLCEGVLAQSAYLPHRVFAAATGVFADFETMLASLASADVVLVGEQHDDPNTHRLQLALLEGLGRRRTGLVLSLEMFERDVQESLDHFATGHLPEAEFLKVARPWPRYTTDYKPLVDLAIEHQWPVVAANLPRPLASEVARSGLAALEAKTGDERRLGARDLQCPTTDEYYARFAKTMEGHGTSAAATGTAGSAPTTPAAAATTAAGTAGSTGTAGATPAAGNRATVAGEGMTSRFYEAQCAKDETMAESIASAWAAAGTGGTSPLVVHMNGAFHSDFRLGTASRVERRLPGRRVMVVSVVPVASLDALAPSPEDRRRGDYLIYTIRRP